MPPRLNEMALYNMNCIPLFLETFTSAQHVSDVADQFLCFLKCTQI